VDAEMTATAPGAATATEPAPPPRPSIIERASRSTLRAQASIARQAGAYPFQFVLDHPGSPTWRDGQSTEVINFGSSNYLGLSTHPEVIAAAQEATRRYGTSTAGPRLYNGTLPLHLQLEEELADFYGKDAAVVFQSGFAANVATLSSLLTPRDFVLFDRDSHASQREGANSGNIPNRSFRHNDMASLRRRVAEIPAATAFAVSVDGLYSMDGSIAPLDEICAITAGAGGALMVDEAHALGVLGATGRGSCEYHDRVADIDLISVSLSKSLASSGGAIIGDRAAVEEISLRARSYIFTASCDPAAIGAALAALRLLRQDPGLPAAARAAARRMREVAAGAGWDAIDGSTPIVCLPVGNRVSAAYVWRLLIMAGVYVNVAIPPAVPENGCLIRLVATAAHSDQDFERLHDALSHARTEMRMARPMGALGDSR
jgi:8-amino-7-oxononanoate synthase